MPYENVNVAWPDGSDYGRAIKPTEQEAIEAVRRLYRVAFKRTYRGKYKITSGWRRTTQRSGTFYVNPDCRGGGWHELVHDMSHYACARLHPGASGHGYQHAFLERQMIEHVVKSGWLEGRLRKPERPAKPVPDKHAVKLERMAAAEKRWTTKLRRAQTALKKLARQRRRLGRSALAAIAA